MHRNEYRALALLRLKEAKILLDAGEPSGAYYLAGYAIECGLKACIAKSYLQHDIPDRVQVGKVYTHNLVALAELAGLAPILDQERASDGAFRVNWAVVKDWEGGNSRYQQHPDTKAKDMYDAVSDRRHGVIRWIKRHW